MANKTINQLAAISSSQLTDNDLLIVQDSESGVTSKISISDVISVSGTKGGFTFSGGFAKRIVSGGNQDPISIPESDVNKWVPLDLSASAQTSTDAPWWPGAAPSNGIDLFGGTALPYGVTRMIDFTQSWSTSGDSDVGTSQSTTRTGTLRFDELETGTTNLLRFDLNITPQVANTTIEVGLWFQPKLSLNGTNDGSAFPLPGSPFFFGTGTVGRTFLSRPITTMYIASDSDRFAYALPMIKSDNPVIIEPLSMLCQNLR